MNVSLTISVSRIATANIKTKHLFISHGGTDVSEQLLHQVGALYIGATTIAPCSAGRGGVGLVGGASTMCSVTLPH